MTGDEASRPETIDPDDLFPSERDSPASPPILDVTGFRFESQPEWPQQVRLLVVEPYVPPVVVETALAHDREPDPVVDQGHDSPDVEVVMVIDSTGLGTLDLPLTYASGQEAIAESTSVPRQPRRALFAGTQVHNVSTACRRMHQRTAHAMRKGAIAVTHASSSTIASGKTLGRSSVAIVRHCAGRLSRSCRSLGVAIWATSHRTMLRVGRHSVGTIHAFIRAANIAAAAARPRILLISRQSHKAVTAATRSAWHTCHIGALAFVRGGRSGVAAFRDGVATLSRSCRPLRVAMWDTSHRTMLRIARYSVETIHAGIRVANNATAAARPRMVLISHQSHKAITTVIRSAWHTSHVGALALVKWLRQATGSLNRSLSLQFANANHARAQLAIFGCGVVLGAGILVLLQQLPAVMKFAFDDSNVSPAIAFVQTPAQAGPIQEATLPIDPPSAAEPSPVAPRVAPGPPFRGSLDVQSSPAGAQVFLNGVLVGATPLVLRNLPVGSRAVRLELDGHRRWSSAVRIVANERTSVAAKMQAD